jgi:hypothetical protein
MAARYALQSFVIRVAGVDDYVTIGALRDSASAQVTGTPASYWSTVPLTLAQVGGCGSLVGYMLARPAGP